MGDKSLIKFDLLGLKARDVKIRFFKFNFGAIIVNNKPPFIYG